ncbi:hypothetical protein GUJ93_ZPchr0007g3412 [Zizania palustris]|uniref:Uncharacterized protein n=1 Tax=Zizania palustris TaxID=103762 RepID=A0A8J5TJL4_ZIZPA|nr:hypothetical protein GUJ93_ZPchr0007g3412 [Zizania palustris]
MKLFAFVRRARRSAAPVEAEPAVVATEAAASASAPAEKRRRRPSGSTAAWKPTLGAISEDGAAVASSGPAREKAKAKAKAKPRTPSPRLARADYGDFRHFGAPTVLPAFAPTAFLF